MRSSGYNYLSAQILNWTTAGMITCDQSSQNVCGANRRFSTATLRLLIRLPSWFRSLVVFHLQILEEGLITYLVQSGITTTMSNFNTATYLNVTSTTIILRRLPLPSSSARAKENPDSIRFYPKNSEGPHNWLFWGEGNYSYILEK